MRKRLSLRADPPAPPSGGSAPACHDPYKRCANGDCGHDLGVGLLVSDLRRDGPHREETFVWVRR